MTLRESKVFALFPEYFEAIEYWQDDDSGAGAVVRLVGVLQREGIDVDDHRDAARPGDDAPAGTGFGYQSRWFSAGVTGQGQSAGANGIRVRACAGRCAQAG